MRKIFKIIGFVVLIIAIPFLIDVWIFGNTFPSNIDNQTWSSFLGGYLGGIATLVAVFITISDNNKKIEMQRKLEIEQLEEQKKYAVRPYLVTRYMFFNEESKFGINDRVFDLRAGKVEKVRYGFTTTDKQFIKMKQSVPEYIYLKYIIRNIGAGSAVDMKVNVNNFSEKISIAKDEMVSLFFLINMEKEKNVPFKIMLDYWDVEKRAHYNQTENFDVVVNGVNQTIVPKEHNLPTEI